MESSVRIVGLGGSMREGSTSLAALQVALRGAELAGARTELLNVRTLGLPMYVPNTEPVPAEVQRLLDTVHEADGMIWSTPLYHGSVSGSFKNALDWLNPLGDREPPYLADKVIGLISTAGGTQGLQAINVMAFIVRALRAWAVPLVLPIPRSQRAFGDNGDIEDEQIETQLLNLGREVRRAAYHFVHTGECDYADY